MTREGFRRRRRCLGDLLFQIPEDQFQLIHGTAQFL
jgi:hypothetical protein